METFHQEIEDENESFFSFDLFKAFKIFFDQYSDKLDKKGNQFKKLKSFSIKTV